VFLSNKFEELYCEVFKLIVPLDAGDAETEIDAESYKPPAIKKQLTPAEIVTVIVSENANPI
jgi:hypothetical protein